MLSLAVPPSPRGGEGVGGKEGKSEGKGGREEERKGQRRKRKICDVRDDSCC